MAITKWWGYDDGYWLPVRWGGGTKEGGASNTRVPSRG